MEEISHNTTVHEKEKPFKCNIFQTSFGKKYVLNSHQRLDHKTEKMIICKICLKIFGSKRVETFTIDVKQRWGGKLYLVQLRLD